MFSRVAASINKSQSTSQMRTLCHSASPSKKSFIHYSCSECLPLHRSVREENTGLLSKGFFLCTTWACFKQIQKALMHPTSIYCGWFWLFGFFCFFVVTVFLHLSLPDNKTSWQHRIDYIHLWIWMHLKVSIFNIRVWWIPAELIWKETNLITLWNHLRLWSIKYLFWVRRHIDILEVYINPTHLALTMLLEPSTDWPNKQKCSPFLLPNLLMDEVWYNCPIMWCCPPCGFLQ